MPQPIHVIPVLPQLAARIPPARLCCRALGELHNSPDPSRALHVAISLAPLRPSSGCVSSPHVPSSPAPALLAESVSVPSSPRVSALRDSRAVAYLDDFPSCECNVVLLFIRRYDTSQRSSCCAQRRKRTWLIMTRTGFDLAHPSAPASPSLQPRLALQAPTAPTGLSLEPRLHRPKLLPLSCISDVESRYRWVLSGRRQGRLSEALVCKRRRQPTR